VDEIVVFKKERKKIEEDWELVCLWSKREVVNWTSCLGVTLESAGGWNKLI
jgi:hypothetical protein